MFRTAALLFALCLPTAGIAGPGFDGVGEGGRAPGLGHHEPVSPEKMEKLRMHEGEILEKVQHLDPEAYERLMRLRERDEGMYWAQLGRMARMLHRASEDPESAERKEEMRDLGRRLRRLRKDYPELDKGEQKERRAEMIDVAGQLMDLKQAERRARIEEMRGKIAHMEAEIDEREQRRDELVEGFVDQMLSEPVDL